MMPQPFDNDLVGDLQTIETAHRVCSPVPEKSAVSDVSLHDRIIALFSEKLNIEVASVDTDLMETGVLDSLAFVELLLHLEQRFRVRIPLENLELDHFRSVACIAKFIANSKGEWYNGIGDSARPISV